MNRMLINRNRIAASSASAGVRGYYNVELNNKNNTRPIFIWG